MKRVGQRAMERARIRQRRKRLRMTARPSRYRKVTKSSRSPPNLLHLAAVMLQMVQRTRRAQSRPQLSARLKYLHHSFRHYLRYHRSHSKPSCKCSRPNQGGWALLLDLCQVCYRPEGGRLALRNMVLFRQQQLQRLLGAQAVVRTSATTSAEVSMPNGSPRASLCRRTGRQCHLPRGTPGSRSRLLLIFRHTTEQPEKGLPEKMPPLSPLMHVPMPNMLRPPEEWPVSVPCLSSRLRHTWRRPPLEEWVLTEIRRLWHRMLHTLVYPVLPKLLSRRTMERPRKRGKKKATVK